MLREFVSATMFLALTLGAHAGDKAQSDAAEFAKDIEQLNGSWRSPTVEFAPGVTGRWELKLELKKDGASGQATALNFVSRSGVFVKLGPAWTAELKEKDKKRFIVLSETKDGKRAEVGEIAYEVGASKLKLTSSKALLLEKRGNPVEMSGEWERMKAAKN